MDPSLIGKRVTWDVNKLSGPPSSRQSREGTCVAFIPARTRVDALPEFNCAKVDAQTSTVDRYLVRVDRGRANRAGAVVGTVPLAPHWYTPRTVRLVSAPEAT